MDKTEGILLVNKPKGKTSFSLVSHLRRHTKVRTIGHAGTLDPFATGLVVLLVGKKYTRLSNQFLEQDKEYVAKVKLGMATDTYDGTGQVTESSAIIPTLDEISRHLEFFQGEIEQIPPMFSAKKINGKKLYELARQGKEIERKPAKVKVKTTLIGYNYPYLDLHFFCSKGTYVRSLAHDLGLKLKTFAHLEELTRLRSGNFHLDNALDGTLIYQDAAPELSFITI